MKKVISSLLLVIALVSCTSQQETVTSIPTVLTRPTKSATSTALPNTPFKTSSPTLPKPLFMPPTIPALTLTAIAPLKAIETDLANRYPDGICKTSYCNLYFSPNGQYILATNSNTIEVFRINGQRLGVYWYYDLYGYKIDYRDGYVSAIHWSKDGSYLYITTSIGGDGGPEVNYEASLARVNLQNGDWKDTGISGLISFSPTDQYIAYSANEGEIRISDLWTGKDSVYTTTDYYQYFTELVWSPDGSKIIFAATPEDWYADNATFALYVIDLDLTTIYKVHESAYPFYYPVSWSEDNTITLDRMNEHGEWTLDLSTNPPRITP